MQHTMGPGHGLHPEQCNTQAVAKKTSLTPVQDATNNDDGGVYVTLTSWPYS